MMLLPFFYRLLGYKPISSGLIEEKIVAMAHRVTRQAVNGLTEDVRKLAEVVSAQTEGK